jgi:CRP-like cAMP-binding protein
MSALAGKPKGAAPTGPQALGPVARKLRKGEMLFSEGENSRAMYFVKTGMIRIFKKKGDSQIEIDTIHAGSVLGELAFLDGNPRSASGEALTDCELAEISGTTFQAVLANIPDWLKILLKTVVGRLRTASTRIRQLEQASAAYDLDRDGKRSAHYVYLPPQDLLKVCTTLLLLASRGGEAAGGKAVTVKLGLLQRYANQIMGVPMAKVTTLMDVLSQSGVLAMADPAAPEAKIVDVEFLEQLIAYLNEEYLRDPTKRHDVTLRGYAIMGYMAKNLRLAVKDERTGTHTLNMAEIKRLETGPDNREPFRYEEFPELVKHGYATNVVIKNGDEAYTQINLQEFIQAYRCQRVVMAVNAVNEQKR